MLRFGGGLFLLIFATTAAAAEPVWLPDERNAFSWLEPASPRPLEPTSFPRLGFGSVLDFGVDVSQFRLLDPGAAVALDLRLHWPGAAEPPRAGALRPYLSLGPTLFLAEPVEPPGAAGAHSEGTLAVGVRAGAGVTWQLDQSAALFSEYHVTRGGPEWLGPLGGRSAGDVTGFDLLYGIRLRF
jgi:hypothetical protein